jgi:UDP-N-acetylglucosamine--N-acetylmuramyl-(pentapeptide) pyrophosphoryl-undecaprenol N-acetylglucosamine transferase
MADCYLAADLMIARSGAVTCAEATALSRFALFIPLPIGNGEQALNAKALVEKGRAQIIPQSDFTSKWLVSNIGNLVEESRRRPVDGDSSGVDAIDKILYLIEQASGAK